MAVVLNKYLKKLKDKCSLPDDFLMIASDLFDKLIEFGYISKYGKSKLSKKLYDNINTVIIADRHRLDYKSGYYDAAKRELYIKDLSNVPAVMLRIMYVITTSEVSRGRFVVGYSSSGLSKKNYKMEYQNFGLNRAVISNLVCRLMHTLPTALTMMPDARKYENDFLGNKIESDNDIYFIEGKLLRQLCFALDVNEEVLYSKIFSINPRGYLYSTFKKIDIDGFLKLLDKVSIQYSNYNKLCYFDKLLSSIHIEIKKHSLNKDIVYESLLKEKKKVEVVISGLLSKLNPNEDFNDIEVRLESSLSENISNFEEDILNNIAKLQSLLVKTLIERKPNLEPKSYAILLKKLQTMLVLENKDLNNEIYETISSDVISLNEHTCTNSVKKIKYSLASYFLQDERFLKAYNSAMFRRIANLTENESTEYVLVSTYDFSEIAYITDLHSTTKKLNNNVEFLKLRNLRHILNIADKASPKIEELFTKLRDSSPTFKNISIDSIFMCKSNEHSFLLVLDKSNVYTIKVDDNFNFDTLELSEYFSILNYNSENLPALYKPAGFITTIFRNFRR